MFGEPSNYFLIGLLILNMGLLSWLLLIAKSGPGGVDSLPNKLGSRFDEIDRNGEVLRRALSDMDQALRAEIAKGARDGLALAFDKVQQGTSAQIEQLGRFGGLLTEIRQLVAEKLAEAEAQAANGRTALVRDTADAFTRAREAIDNSLRIFGDQQHERLVAAEQAVREAKQATEASGKKTEAALGQQQQAVTSQLAQNASEISERLRKELGDLSDRVRIGFDGFSERLREQQEQLREKVEGKLDELRSGNEAKLEEMRQAVDEKLQSALENRLNESFRHIAEHFVQIQQAIGQVKDVTGQIGDLKRLFSNIKMRGGIGEDHLGVLLSDFLPPGSYEKNFRIDESSETVEYAIRIPTKGGAGDKWLAIDAKFPKEDYERLLTAAESSDREQENLARRGLERKIREEAKKISEKYIKPPQTLDFAIMYLPSEGLDSEVSQVPGLIDTLRRDYKIYVVGPRVLPAHLNIIRVGYLTLTLEEQAAAVGEILSAVKTEWGKLGKWLDVTANRANTLVKGINETQKRARVVGKTLKTIGAIDFERAQQVLGLSEEALLIEADADSDDGIPIIRPEPAESLLDPELRNAAQ